MKHFYGIFLFFVVVKALEDVVLEDHWTSFQAQHSKKYSSPEEAAQRKVIFAQNLDLINHHNAHRAASVGYTMGINQFTDMTPEEFQASYAGKLDVPKTESLQNIFAPSNDVVIPDSIDWRTEGAVTPVKSQGSCGACWSFSSTGALEGAYFIKTGSLKSFSEQQLIDCTKGTYHNGGCNGGWMNNAFSYVKDHGIEEEDVYPYRAQIQNCTNDSSKYVTSLSGFTSIPEGSEDDMLQAVAQQPVSVALSITNWQYYKSGVFNDTCETNPQHAVLITGYGTEDGVPYWLVKNCWTDQWGVEGYIKIIRGFNRCGIAKWASYPTI